MSNPFDFEDDDDGEDTPIATRKRKPKKKSNRHAKTSFAYAAICFVLAGVLVVAGQFMAGIFLLFLAVLFQVSGYMHWNR
jgi:hypothetical protein